MYVLTLLIIPIFSSLFVFWFVFTNDYNLGLRKILLPGAQIVFAYKHSPTLMLVSTTKNCSLLINLLMAFKTSFWFSNLFGQTIACPIDVYRFYESLLQSGSSKSSITIFWEVETYRTLPL